MWRGDRYACEDCIPLRSVIIYALHFLSNSQIQHSDWPAKCALFIDKLFMCDYLHIVLSPFIDRQHGDVNREVLNTGNHGDHCS